MGEIPYQNATQVAQLLAERENATAYGQTSRLEAIAKQLAGLGWVDPAKAARARAAAAAKAEVEEPSKTPPQGRTSRRQQTTTKSEEE